MQLIGEIMKLGVLIPLNDEIDTEFKKVHDLGFPTCQLNGWDQSRFTADTAHQVVNASQKHQVAITAFWCGWEGPAVWNFSEGPLTLGLVPGAFRHERLKMLMCGADFAVQLGVTDLVTHVGFIPENPNEAEYRSLVSTLRYLVQYCQGRGLHFLFETGQETPVTLLRTIEDIGLPNLGINLDPANLILYGKANPVDALDVFGSYVRGVHAKDGLYPTSGSELGREVPLGQGKVNFPALVSKLKELGYPGALTIEREISGEQQIHDIQMAKKLLESLTEDNIP
jgi:L-ribulose-5-phosphate 3-epimerase